MKKIILIMLMFSSVTLYASSDKLSLIHVKGINSIGIRTSTAFFNDWGIGAYYNYTFHHRWTFTSNVDYNAGNVGKADYKSIILTPGIEFAPWQPCRWLYFHITGSFRASYDWWHNAELNDSFSGFAVGAELGINFEAYVIPQLSFVLSADQCYSYGLYEKNDHSFFPRFAFGIRAHIR